MNSCYSDARLNPASEISQCYETAIAVLCDVINGEDTATFYFSAAEVEAAEKQYKNSKVYSVELLSPVDQPC